MDGGMGECVDLWVGRSVDKEMAKRLVMDG